MQQLALEQRRRLGPRAPWHVGDVAWRLRQHEGREPEWMFRLWHDGDDRMVEAPDGRFAAYVLVWPDDDNGFVFALRRLHKEGLGHAVVGCITEPACTPYESVGFHRVGSLVAYSR
jgi:hypothetical protein